MDVANDWPYESETLAEGTELSITGPCRLIAEAGLWMLRNALRLTGVTRVWQGAVSLAIDDPTPEEASVPFRDTSVTS